MRSAGILIGGIALALALGAVGAIGEAKKPSPAAFDQHVKAAQRLYKEGDYARTVEELNAAYALRKEPRLLYNLGHAYSRLGDSAAALRSFEEFLKRERRVPTELRADIEHLMDVLREKIANPAPASSPALPAVTAGAAERPTIEEVPVAAVQRRHQWQWRRKGSDGSGSRGTKYLLGVWGSSASSLWAVGSGGTILRYDGQWRFVDSSAHDDLHAVWGSGPDDVWFVGDGGQVLRWDGTAIRAIDTGESSPLYGIWGTGPDDLWIVGDNGVILHKSGATFVRSPSRSRNLLLGVWGPDSNETWAVGTQGVILRRSGATWSRIASSTDSGLFAVCGTRPNRAWAVGEGGTALTWDGTRWQLAQTGTSRVLYSVACGEAEQAWATGAGGAMMRWDGKRFRLFDSQTESDLRALWHRASTDFFAVGLGGLILNFTFPREAGGDGE